MKGGRGGLEAMSYFLTSLGEVDFQLNGEFPFRGGGGSGDKRQEFPFFGDVELLIDVIP